MNEHKHPAVREMWHLLETVHAVVYFAPEPRAALADAGLRGFWMGYFASRAAAMGPVGPDVVTATFYNFAPSMVRRALPDAWTFAAPSEVLAARMRGVDDALRRLLGPLADALGDAADVAWQAVAACGREGRPLFAAHAGVARSPEPHLALWQATTALREHRGDGHAAALVVAGVDGCEAHVLAVADGRAARDTLQPNRGWSDDEWHLATLRLVERGWLSPEGRLTEAGTVAVRGIEDETDRLALAPWLALGQDQTRALADLVAPAATAIVRAGAISYPNPVGVPRPAGMAG